MYHWSEVSSVEYGKIVRPLSKVDYIFLRQGFDDKISGRLVMGWNSIPYDETQIDWTDFNKDIQTWTW
jgi:hypothetical protein